MKYLFTLLFFFSMNILTSQAQTRDEKAVAQAVEDLRKAMVDPDRAVFDKLISASVSYGHSLGLVEDKKTCIEAMMTGKFNFESIEITDQTVQITDQTAVVRHNFFAHTHDAGKEPGTVKLKVLQVWIKHEGRWQLLARQAVRLPS